MTTYRYVKAYEDDPADPDRLIMVEERDYIGGPETRSSIKRAWNYPATFPVGTRMQY